MHPVLEKFARWLSGVYSARMWKIIGGIMAFEGQAFVGTAAVAGASEMAAKWYLQHMR